MEVELKLLVNPNDADALRRHPLLQQYANAPAREQRMSDLYFDTPQQQFKACGAGLRVRRVGDTWVQTLKAGGEAGAGLHRRHEWESPVPGPEPDLAALRKQVGRDNPWGELLCAPTTKQSLAPIFGSSFTRTLWLMRLPSGDEVEFAFDQGKLECGDETVPVSEIELELKSGNAIHLFDLALALHRDIPMQVGTLSKAERGYRLCGRQARTVATAASVKLARRGSVEQAFKAITTNCLAQIQANAADVARDYDEESLHQMHVGLRRLRFAVGLFKDVLQLPQDIAQDLDWLTHELGNARDWDVMSRMTLPSLTTSMAGDSHLADVVREARAASYGAHAAASAAVASPRYTRLVLALGRWLYGNGWRHGGLVHGKTRLEVPAAGFAHKALRRAHKRLKKRGRLLGKATPDERRRARIAAKKMRYATEFFASLYRGKQVRPFVKALSAMQDELGRLNDAVVAGHLLGQMALDRLDLAGAIPPVCAALAAAAKGHGSEERQLWKRYVAVKPPR